MAASATAPAVRIASLRKALDRARVECAPGEVLTLEATYRLIGVSRKTMREWVDEIDGFEESGCFVRGSEGTGYQFSPIATIWYLIRHFERVRDERSDKARRDREIAGGEALAEVPETFDLDQTRKLVDLSMRTQEMKERAGQLVPVAPINATLRRAFSEINVAIHTTPQELDPTGKWSPAERDLADKVSRAAALRAQQAARKVVSEERETGESSPGKAAA